MAVVFDAISTTDIWGNGATSFSNSTLTTVGTGINRALIFVIVWQTDTAPTGVSITWDGIGLSLISGTSVGTAGAVCNIAIYGLLNPASGTKTLAGSWTGAKDFASCVVAYSGVEQSSFVNAFKNGANANGTGTTSSVTVNSSLGDAVVGVFGNSVHGFSTTTNITVFNEFTNTFNILAAASRDIGAASVNLTYDIGSGGGAWVAGGTSIAQAGSTNLMAQISM